eukprot:scaffold33083_cov129-Isochrysis_galbana.AAC.2
MHARVSRLTPLAAPPWPPNCTTSYAAMNNEPNMSPLLYTKCHAPCYKPSILSKNANGAHATFSEGVLLAAIVELGGNLAGGPAIGEAYQVELDQQALVEPPGEALLAPVGARERHLVLGDARRLVLHRGANVGLEDDVGAHAPPPARLHPHQGGGDAGHRRLRLDEHGLLVALLIVVLAVPVAEDGLAFSRKAVASTRAQPHHAVPDFHRIALPRRCAVTHAQVAVAVAAGRALERLVSAG